MAQNIHIWQDEFMNTELRYCCNIFRMLELCDVELNVLEYKEIYITHDENEN